MNFTMKSPLRLLIALCCVVAMSLEFTGCSDDDVNTGQLTLQSNSTLGDFIADGKGKTLYIFSNDVNGQSQCTGTCLADWPIYYAADLKPAVGVDAADFATITRADGAKQTTYKGWPLYYFAGDHATGDVNGEAVGNIWFVAKPGGYSLMLGNGQLVGKDGKSYTSNYTEGTGATEYIVDAKGRTVYMFSKDFNGVNKFTNTDATHNAIWPIFYTEVTTLPSTLNKDDFGQISVFGNNQLTYKGHPLYYFGEDANAGETKGVSQGLTGGVPTWPIVNAQTAVAATQPTVMTTTNATLGTILTDNIGRTLYYFARDTKGTVSACTGTCLTKWPTFYTDHIVLPQGSTLNASDFGTIGSGTTLQTTYKGRPLYWYAPLSDGVIEPAGATGGDNVGTIWFAAKADYSLMVGSAQLVGANGKNYTSAYVEGTEVTRYLTDAAGRTLYIFYSTDKNNTNNFTAADFSNDTAWPIFNVDITKLPTGLNTSDFGHITFHGRSQLTYKGWPVYYFGSDAAKGDTKGVSAGTPGNWRVLTSATIVAPL
jgi:predicted lipoprotein with Yx(FWY)xxD motif